MIPYTKPQNTGEQLLKVGKWLLAIVFLVIATGTSQFLTTIPIILIALLIIPILDTFWRRNIPLLAKRSAKIGTLFGLLIISLIAANDQNKSINSSKTDSKVNTDTIPDDTIVVESEPQALHDQQVEDFKKNLSGWDGSCLKLVRYVKNDLNDPDSFEHVDTGFWIIKDHAVVIMKYRAKNAFGALIVTSIKAKVGLNGEVLEIIE
jgi:hypothetical protein